MRIEVRGVEASNDLATYAERRIWSWISYAERGLTSVTVCLKKETGNGGPKTRCRMEARPVPRSKVAVNVVVQESDVDPYEAVDRSAERLSIVIAQLSQARLIGREAAA